MRKRAQSSGKALVMALPLAIGWTIYTAQPTPGNFLLAYVLSLVVIMATGQRGDNFRLRNLPLQLYNLIAYVLFLAKEVLVSGVKVALIVLAPELKISPGTTELSTFDESRNELISAISAHGITITPGELVVDFKVANGEGATMIVHSLTSEASAERLEEDQRLRLKRIKGILGHD
ncbi:MAG: hypothetical protein F4X02_00545 [Chloroflexi bacterium]|nr:hypothetical protein [Chloroflexota bacterium]